MAIPDSTLADRPTVERETTVARVVDRWRESYDRRDVEGVLDLMADDIVWVLAPGAFTGKEEVRRFLEGMCGSRRRSGGGCRESGYS